MTATITVRSHPRKRPASSIAAEERRKEMTARLQREIEAKQAPAIADLESNFRTRRARLIEIFQPWYWRQT